MRPEQDVGEGIIYHEDTKTFEDRTSRTRLDLQEDKITDTLVDRHVKNHGGTKEAYKDELLKQQNPSKSNTPPRVIVGASGNIPGYGLSVAPDELNKPHVTKTFSFTSLFGGSLDLVFGDGNNETTFGSSKYSSLGVLWDFTNEGSVKISGAAIHFGWGISTPITVSVRIPRDAPPFSGHGE